MLAREPKDPTPVPTGLLARHQAPNLKPLEDFEFF